MACTLKPKKSENLANVSLEQCKKFLQLPPRQWISEQIFLINQTLCKNKDTGASIKRKSIGLKHQFSWFVWAISYFWYFYMGGKSRNVIQEFEQLTETLTEMPSEREDWFKGFLFKNVKFLMTHQASYEAKKLKSEVKDTKLLYLENINSGNGLVFPLNYFVNIGPFVLLAVVKLSLTFL